MKNLIELIREEKSADAASLVENTLKAKVNARLQEEKQRVAADIFVEYDLTEAIQNPNSSKQGHDPEHETNPFHGTLTKHGYKYSHSTPIMFPGDEKVIHHTYKHGSSKSANAVGVYKRANKGHQWDSRSMRSKSYGAGTSGNSLEHLDKHLTSHLRQFSESSELHERVGLPRIQYIKGKPVPTPESEYFTHFKADGMSATEARERIATISKQAMGADKLEKASFANEFSALRSIIVFRQKQKRRKNNLPRLPVKPVKEAEETPKPPVSVKKEEPKKAKVPVAKKTFIPGKFDVYEDEK